MRRGTTPIHTFTLPFNVPDESCIRIVYAQNDKIILERTTETCSVNSNAVSIRLTDEETLLFDCSSHWVNGKFEPYMVEIQIGIKTPNGDKLWSDIITETPERCLRKDGVI